jgi:hypothetical protein
VGNLTQARKEIADYIDTYHRRPHSGIGYPNPAGSRRHLATRPPTTYKPWRPDPSTTKGSSHSEP